VRAGATWIQGTSTGWRARETANLGELALTLRALYGVESNLRLVAVLSTCRHVLQELVGYALRVEARPP